MLALTTTSASPPARLKTRVGGSTSPRAFSHRGFPRQHRGPHRETTTRARRFAVGSRKYLSPEPLLQNPNWVASQLRSGRQVPSYSYALNNPVRYADRDGLRVELMDAEAFRVAANPRIHNLLRWLDSSPDTYRLYGNVSLAGVSAFGHFFPGENHERGFTSPRGGTIAIDSNLCSARRLPPMFPAGHEGTHAGLMDAWLNPMSSSERGPMPPEVRRFLDMAGPGGGLPGDASDSNTPHGTLQRVWWPR